MRIGLRSLGLAWCLGLVAVASATAEFRLPESVGIVYLDKAWEYRIGDSPTDVAGRPLWAQAEYESEGWQTFDYEQGLQAPEASWAWFRVYLPLKGRRDPVLLVERVFLQFEAYLDGTLIYRSGDLQPHAANRYQAFRHHLVPLPEDFAGKLLYLRVYSDSPGFLGPDGDFLYDSRDKLMQLLIEEQLGQFLLGHMLVLIGLAGLYIFLRRRDRSALAFGVLAVSVGLYTVGFTNVRQFFEWENPAFWWYVSGLSFLLFPVGMWAYFELVVAQQYSWILRRLWQIHLLYAAGALSLDLIGLWPLIRAQEPFFALLMVGMAIYLVINFKSRRQECLQGGGNVEVHIQRLSMLILMGTGLHDILLGYDVFDGHRLMFQWGVFIFVLLLAYLLERQFAHTHSQLQVQSEQLQATNEQLEQYSHRLEERVAERTRDLEDKNGELEATVGELHATRDQMVMQEKMASLGNLVAGVAHEVNNPIGAVHSAADVSARCMGRLLEVLEQEPVRGHVQDNRPFQKAVQVLQDNTRLTRTASERIVEIVQSLKNFARLDEAEFQRADLHAGIDSTLTLVHHEIKNKAEVVRQYGTLPLVECAPNQLNQVFMNLLVNAAQALAGKGTVTIRTWAEEGWAYICIADNGKGIPADMLDRIFDPGVTTKGVGVGTGLGLSICYRILQAHRGRIDVESQVGQGSAFTVKLPVDQEEEALAAG
ncbi:MAG: hypothetical protein GKR89_04710 [Candidatus Latescibacteria bacterium]|nr:hypothetical protein [Candidatus Latescibacterota bacterium]